MAMCNGNKILHIFLYNPMVRDSGWIPQSIHKTRKGAEQALETHKEEVINDLRNRTKEPIESQMDWRICEYELLS